MSKQDKLKQRLLTKPRDFKYLEAKTLLNSLGFKEYSKGKTSGSRVKFYRSQDQKVILLHKPHPGGILKLYMINNLINYLEEIGEL